MITIKPTNKINYAAKGRDAILQNVNVILNTMLYEQPMERGFAWSAPIDAPINVVQMRAMGLIIDAIQEYEPHVEVRDVDFDGDAVNGVLIPTVKVVIRDESI